MGIAYLDTDTSATVAQETASAINSSGLDVTATATGSMVVVTTPTGGSLIFTPGTSNVVTPVYNTVKVNGSQINLIGHTVTDGVSVPVGGTANLPISDVLPGDDYANYLSNTRGQNNDFEGWFVDDVEVGFAGRGEMASVPATDASADKDSLNFTFAPTPPNPYIGYYTLQVRRASDYGNYNPLLNNPPLAIETDFDVNDQLSDGLSMNLPPADDIANGETFSISDGTYSVTFQFLGEGVNDGVANPNYQPIYFTVNQTEAGIATDVATAINLANTRGLFDVEATAGGVENTNTYQLQATSAANIPDGTTFQISGTTFEFTTLAVTPGSALADGNSAVVYSLVDSDDQIAEDIALAIDHTDVAYKATAENNIDVIVGQGLGFAGLGNTLTELSMGGIAEEGGLYLFQAVSVTTSWTAPVVQPAANTLAVPLADTEQDVQYTLQGDLWTVMDQGEDIIEQASILNSAEYGVDVRGGPTGTQRRDGGPAGADRRRSLGAPLSTAVLRAVDANSLVPGIMIENNVIADSGTGGVLFSGEASGNGGTQAAAPFGRIVNNTIYGGAQTTAQHKRSPAPASPSCPARRGQRTPPRRAVYRSNLSAFKLGTITSLTIADNSGGLAGGPVGAYSGLDLDGLMVSNAARAGHGRGGGRADGRERLQLQYGRHVRPRHAERPRGPQLVRHQEQRLEQCGRNAPALRRQRPQQPNPVRLRRPGRRRDDHLHVHHPAQVVQPGTFLYIAVSEDKGQFTGQHQRHRPGANGTGIVVENNASPTILNNIVADPVGHLRRRPGRRRSPTRPWSDTRCTRTTPWKTTCKPTTSAMRTR